MDGDRRNGRDRSGAPEPWVLVAGGFHRSGAMDRANAELARHLAQRGNPLHLVAHQVDADLAQMPSVTAHEVARPAGSILLGERLLDRAGRAVAAAVTEGNSAARVVVNGGNCAWPDINWVHAVHRAWPPAVAGAPLLFRARRQLETWTNVRRELAALCSARLVIANSDRTRTALLELLGLDHRRVRTVWLGCDLWREVGPERRAAARAWLATPAGRPLVVFVGALGHDRNKGFDVLLEAWQQAAADPGWDANLIVAGGGRALDYWRGEVARRGLDAQVTLLGFTDRIADLMAAADLLVSPARYEAYGLSVHEALSCGVPAIVSACAGIADLYPAAMREMLLPNPDDAADLAARLMRWRADMAGWRARVEPFAAALRKRTWDGMAAEIVALAAESRRRAGAAEIAKDG
jgi:glycosyltransferase involved in cell wall biosynthesis